MSVPSFRGTRRSCVAAAASWIAAALVVSSCGGSDKPDTPSSPAPPGTDPGIVQIRGGERLGWIQRAASLDGLRSHSFRFFVDDNLATLSDTRCGDVAGPNGYECSGRLPTLTPGRHTLEITAVWNGEQSSRSQPLTVMVLAQQTSLPESDLQRNPLAADGAASIASGLARVAWLSPMPDGRLLFVENERAVRVIANDELLTRPAYLIDRARDTIVGMAIDPAFERTRAVYLAWTEFQRDGSRALGVSRFRDVGDTLGQEATIVTGLPFPDAGLAPIDVDDDGLVYLALPALRGAGGRSEAAYNGFVLRFAADGSVPPTNPHTSPILATGFAEPSALAIDRAGRRVWMAGTHPSWKHTVAAFSIARNGAVWPELPEPALPEGAMQPGFTASSLAITSLSAVPGTLSLVSAGVARRAAFASNGAVGSFETVRFSAPGAVSAFVDGHRGDSYAAVETTDRRAVSILRIPQR